jgi:hypothetical protein
MRSHQRAVFGERAGQHRGELEPYEVVTDCDHLSLLRRAEKEGKIGGDAFLIAFDCLVERLGGHPVKFGQVGIENDFPLADREDAPVERDGFDQSEARVFGLGGIIHGSIEGRHISEQGCPPIHWVGMVNTGEALVSTSKKLNRTVTALRVVFETRSRRSIQNHRPS